MTQLGFTIVGAGPEPHAAVPIINFRLRIAESGGARLGGIVLRCQIRIEPQRRHYSGAEEERLFELFGEPERWGDSLKAMAWTHATVVVPAFQDQTEADLPLVCTYDFEVAAAKYMSSLESGEIPLLFLFSGLVFAAGETGMMVDPIPWEREAAYRLPVAVWRAAMDLHFPGTAWIRLRRESFEALHRFKSRRALPTWEDALDALLEAAERERV
jgi:hypothetical protein